MSDARELDVGARIEALYGDRRIESFEGVVHVVAVWDAPPGWTVLRIGPQTPRSPTDGFVLALARARADVIVTTAKILRDEPTLDYGAPGPHAAALQRWRAQVRGRTTPPTIAVLTASGHIDPAHPTLRGPADVVAVTGTEGAAVLAARGIASTALAQPSVHGAIAWARARGARTVLVEAGPSTTAALYEAPVAVDELMISIYAGEAPPPAVRGTAFAIPSADAVPLAHASPASPVQEASGPWFFRRFWREQTDRVRRPLNRDRGGAETT